LLGGLLLGGQLDRRLGLVGGLARAVEADHVEVRVQGVGEGLGGLVGDGGAQHRRHRPIHISDVKRRLTSQEAPRLPGTTSPLVNRIGTPRAAEYAAAASPSTNADADWPSVTTTWST